MLIKMSMETSEAGADDKLNLTVHSNTRECAPHAVMTRSMSRRSKKKEGEHKHSLLSYLQSI